LISPEINFRAISKSRLKPAIFYSPLQRGSATKAGVVAAASIN